MTEYDKGYRDGLCFVLNSISRRALEVGMFRGWYRMINKVMDDIANELLRKRNED